MTPNRTFTASAIIAFSIAHSAIASPFDAHINRITMHNIAAMQHSIATNAIQTFEGTMAAALGNRARFNIPDADKSSPHGNEYGQFPQYGQMPIYGEYNDDGSATQHGRNGGDITPLPSINSMWANWQHFDDNTKFKTLDTIDTDYDLITIGLAGAHAQIGHGVSQWGLYGGYAGSTQTYTPSDINENGGYMGIYSGYNISNFNISASFNTGAMFSNTDFAHDKIHFSNAWLAATIHGTYNIAIDDTLTLQPGMYAGYTWIKSDNYTFNRNRITTDNLKVFEITPEIRAIKHIGAGWFGSASVRYVADWTTGNKTTVNDTPIDDLDSDNYTEYGIGLEKSIDRFNIALHIGRRDGGRTGWNGGTSFKYIF